MASPTVILKYYTVADASGRDTSALPLKTRSWDENVDVKFLRLYSARTAAPTLTT